MRTRVSFAIVLGILSLAVALPAGATHNGEQPPAGCRYIRGTDTPENHDDDVYVCRQDAWIHKGTARIGNLAGAGQGTLPSWNTTPPTGTLQNDAGFYATNRAVEIQAPYDPTHRPTFRGTFTGTLDDLAFSLYLRCPGYEATSTAWPMLVRLTIDDQTIFENVSPNNIGVTMKVAGNLRKIDVAFNNIYKAMQDLEMDLGQTKQHAIELSIIQRFYGDGHTVMFYDSADAPSGLIFNLPPASQGPYVKINVAPEA